MEAPSLRGIVMEMRWHDEAIRSYEVRTLQSGDCHGRPIGTPSQ
jgi:hypothetical protein